VAGSAGWIAEQTCSFVLVTGHHLFLSLHRHEETCAVVIGREQLALVTDNERAGDWERAMVPTISLVASASGRSGFSESPGFPSYHQNFTAANPHALETQSEAGGLWEGLRVNTRGNFALDHAWVAQLQARTACDGVTGHVTQRAGAEFVPAAPLEGVINILLEGALLPAQQESQSRYVGTGSWLWTVEACGQTGRLVQTCNSSGCR